MGGLWSKGLDRSLTGEERFGDMVLNRDVLNKICDYIDRLRDYYDEVKPDSYCYECTYKTKGERIEFKIFGQVFIIQCPKGKDNIPWLMQMISGEVYHLRRIKTGLDILHRVIETNRLRWMYEDWNNNDEVFLTYPKHLI